MQSCKICSSMAINPNLHGRELDVDLDLCDVCYWKKKFEYEHHEKLQTQMKLESVTDEMNVLIRINDNYKECLEIKNNNLSAADKIIKKMEKEIKSLEVTENQIKDLRQEINTLKISYESVVAERNIITDDLYKKTERMKSFVPDSTWYDLIKNAEVKYDRVVFKFWIYTFVIYKEDFIESLKNDIVENESCKEVVKILQATFDSVVTCGMCKYLTNEMGKRIYCKKKHKVHIDNYIQGAGVYQSWYSFKCKDKCIPFPTGYGKNGKIIIDENK